MPRNNNQCSDNCCSDNGGFQEQGSTGFQEMSSVTGVTVTPGADLTGTEKGAVLAAISQANRVSTRKLEQKIQAGSVAVYHEAGRLGATATLKDVSDSYRQKVSERSRVRIPEDAQEISYHAGTPAGIAKCLTALVEEHGGPVYSTVLSTDAAGLAAMTQANFRKMGTPYPSRNARGANVLLYVKS